MAIGDAIRAGLELGDFVRNNATKQQESKLKAQLYGAQAKHYDAQNQLINMEVQQKKAYLEGLAGALTGGGQEPPGAPSVPGAPSPGMLNLPAPGIDAPSTNAPLRGLGGGPVGQASPQPQPRTPGTSSEFLDPQEQLMDRLSLLALKTGNIKDYGTMQQGMIERQKIRTTARLQELQNKLAFLQNAEAGPMSPEDRAQVRNAKAALLFQVGKSNDALQLLEGKLIALQPGAELTQTFPGQEGTQVLRTNPNRPVVAGPEATVYELPTTPGGQARPLTPKPVPGQRAEQNAEAAERGRDRYRNAPAAPTISGTDTQGNLTPEQQTRMAKELVEKYNYTPEHAAEVAATLPAPPPGKGLNLKPPAAAPKSPPAGASGPLPGSQRYDIQNQDGTPVLDRQGQPGFVDIKAGDTKGLADLATQFPAYKFVPAGAAPRPQGPSGETNAQRNERLKLQTQQDTKTGQPGSTQGDVVGADLQARLNTEYYGSARAPSGEPNATAAMLERIKESERLRTQGLQPNNPNQPIAGQNRQAVQDVEAGKPGATQGDVTATTTQARLNTEFYGQGTPPPGQPNATQLMLDAGREQTQPVPETTGQRVNALLHAQRLTKALQDVPQADQERYVGFLRRPRAQLNSLFADISTAAKGDPQLYTFLANASDLFYTLARPDVGANYTGIEKELLTNIYPDTGSRTYTQFKAALERLAPTLEQKIKDQVAMTGTTRGTLGKSVQERQRGTSAPKSALERETPAASPGTTETPEAQAERLRQKYGIPKRTP